MNGEKWWIIRILPRMTGWLNIVEIRKTNWMVEYGGLNWSRSGMLHLYNNDPLRGLRTLSVLMTLARTFSIHLVSLVMNTLLLNCLNRIRYTPPDRCNYVHQFLYIVIYKMCYSATSNKKYLRDWIFLSKYMWFFDTLPYRPRHFVTFLRN